MDCKECGMHVSVTFVALFDYCPRCEATPFPEVEDVRETATRA